MGRKYLSGITMEGHLYLTADNDGLNSLSLCTI